MKLRFALSLLIVAAMFFVLGQTTTGKSGSVTEQTQKNLSSAMHGEAFAFAKYSLYSRQARQDGDEELANLFEEAANTERLEHFAEEAHVAGLVRGDADNLKDAIKGESYEVETMYLNFAKEARFAGDDVAADRFEEIRHDEIRHRDAFKAALTKLEPNTAEAR